MLQNRKQFMPDTNNMSIPADKSIISNLLPLRAVKRKFMRNLFFIFSLFLSVSTGFAADVELKNNHPQKYVVQKGDTLWGISGKFLKSPWLWPNVWYANPQVKNPHLIYPGDSITLVYIDGKPQLRIDRGRPHVKLTPSGRVVALNRPIPTIGLAAIRPFLTKHQIVDKNTLKKSPYILRAVGERLITGTGDKVYVRGHKSDKHSDFLVVRKGQVYSDPHTKEILGYEAKYVGDSRMIRYGDPATHYLSNTSREVLIGDRLLKFDHAAYNDNFVPHAPKADVKGHIIAVMEGVTQIGQHQVVVINKGKRDGMEVGHVLAIYQKGKKVEDTVRKSKAVQLPDERAGLLMVFRTFDKLSYALIMKATTNMHVLDAVVNP